MTLAWLVALTLLLTPDAAHACAACISSAYGDRTYNVAYLGLLLVPFVLAIAVGGILTRCYLASRREPTEIMGGPDMAPHTPQSLGSGPGGPGRSSILRSAGGPEMAPHTPQRSEPSRGGCADAPVVRGRTRETRDGPRDSDSFRRTGPRPSDATPRSERAEEGDEAMRRSSASRLTGSEPIPDEERTWTTR